MKLRAKSTLLSAGKIRAFKLTDEAMQDLRQKLIGANVYLGDPDSDYGHRLASRPVYSLQDCVGIIESVDGDDLIINLFKDSKIITIMEEINLKTTIDFTGRVENKSISEIVEQPVVRFIARQGAIEYIQSESE